MKSFGQNTYFLTFFILIILAVFASIYYRYIVQEDFQFFLTEDEIPDQFDVTAY